MIAAVAVTGLTAIAWVYLLVCHGMFWRTDQRLPASLAGSDAGGPGGRGPWPSVTAVIPARDEAEILPVSLPTLLSQDYPGQLLIMLVDDQSTDGTAKVAAELGRAAGWAVRSAPLGWLGWLGWLTWSSWPMPLGGLGWLGRLT
jgi:cellulose synthase/poly-beta-1,6-N-acetylglucosamine synthase-like glycosyltransferase